MCLKYTICCWEKKCVIEGSLNLFLKPYSQKMENMWLFSFCLIVLWQFYFFCGLFPLHSWDVHWHPSLLFRRWSVEYCKTLVWWQVIWSKCIALQWICQDCSDTISINIDALSSGVPLILLRLVTYMLHQRFQYYLSFMLQGFWNTLSIVCCSKQNTMFWYINLFLFWGSKLMR